METKQMTLEQFSMILDNLDMAICLVNSNTDIIYWNNVYLHMLGCDEEQLLRDYGRMRDVVREGRLDHSYSIDVLRIGKKVQGCQKILDIHDKPHYHYAVHIPIFGENGQVEYSLGIIQDIAKIRADYMKAIETLDNNVVVSMIRPSEEDKRIVFGSPSMNHLVRDIVTIARTGAAVLLQGESGTGKDLFANMIHLHSAGASGKMIAVNCASIPPDLFESELFGYSGGSFTGALNKGKKGLIEEADGGTLFLDEINSMPLPMQSKLLRVLESKTVKRVGSNEEKHVNFRLVSASNVDLMECVRHGTFRLDLFFRLNVVSLTIPPLRERKEDIPLLVEHFTALYNNRYNRTLSFSKKAVKQLCEYSWPGNVRELKNLLERVILLTDPTADTIQMIADYFFYTNAAECSNKEERGGFLIDRLSFDENIEYYERRILTEACSRYSSMKELEQALQISHSTLYRKMVRYNLKVGYLKREETE